MMTTEQTSQRGSTGKLALLTLALAAALILAALTACSHDGLAGNGTVHVFLTDAPLDLTGVTAVNVTVGEVSLHTEEDIDGNSERLTLVGGEPWIFTTPESARRN